MASYSKFRQFSMAIEGRFGDHKSLRWSRRWEWHHLGKRDPANPYQINGSTVLVDKDSNPGLKDIKVTMGGLDRVLDFGSSTPEAREFLSIYIHGGENYYSLDPDPDVDTDFNSLDDIPADMKFDGIVSREVFEHIPREEIEGVISGLSNVMSTNGIIVASMPNVLNPNYFINNYDHKNQMKYNHLGALFSLYNIELIDAYLFENRAQRYDYIHGFWAEQEKTLGLLWELFSFHPANHVAVVGMKRNSREDFKNY